MGEKIKIVDKFISKLELNLFDSNFISVEVFISDFICWFSAFQGDVLTYIYIFSNF